MKLALLAIAVLLSQDAFAQSYLVAGEFPFWAEKAWAEAEKRSSLQISRRVNPFVWRGDFNGDGHPDFAVLVVDPKTKKEGIAFLFQRGKTIVVGAGSEFGNGGDDFSWIDMWHVEDKGTGHGNYRGQSVTLRADGLMVAKESSASALIYFRNGKPIWQQYGD